MSRKPAKITNCPHPDRRHFAKGMCKSCYNGKIRPEPSASAIRGKEWYHTNIAVRVYGDGITRDSGVHFFVVASDPNDDLVKGSRFIQRDFLASLIAGNWPEGLIVKNSEAKRFTVRYMERFSHAVLQRDDGVIYSPSGNGQNYQLTKVKNGKSD